MAPNPISYQEIEAYARSRGISMTPWESETLTMVDDAVLAAMAAGPASPAETAPQIPVTDTKAVGSMLKGLAAARKQG